ncbi:hypothetical protein CFAM422_002758 [Trichoderma lentiforme]|uniref:Uncharacterized protein n=1 Tax=Trichoderma lentiforme TaxID=1567552 RepID=A0A9P5CE79_9HYPO|nr:hypothetical protein CFAM422_002758 [Trichoderma lentiforme]
MPISPADFELTMVCQVYDNWAVGNVETASDDAGPCLFSTASDLVSEAPTQALSTPIASVQK